MTGAHTIDDESTDAAQSPPERTSSLTRPSSSSSDEKARKSPTAGLRRVSGPIPLAGWFIVVNEFCERFAYYGASTLFQNYVQYPPPPPSAFGELSGEGQLQPGALGRGQATATALNNFFTFWCYSTPLLGAFVSDQYLGKFKTIALFSVVYAIGWVLLTSTSVPGGHAEDGTPQYGSLNFIGFIVSISVIGVGTGGIKSVVSPMCADQIPLEDRVVTTKKGEAVVQTNAATIQHLYNWFYWAINVGAIVGVAVCVQMERLPEGYWKAFLIPACMFLIAVALFISARRLYRVVPPSGSVFTSVWHCISYALERQQRYMNNVSPQEYRRRWPRRLAAVLVYLLLAPLWIAWWIVRVLWRQIQIWRGIEPSAEELRSFKFLDFAEELPNEPVAERVQRYWDPSFPRELRQTLKACTIFLPLTVYWVCYNQMTSNLISQAAQMQRPAWLSNDLLTMLDPLALIVLIPVADSVLYPLLQRWNVSFMYMKRMTVGFLLGGLSMLWAAYTQQLIYQAPPGYDHPLVDADGNPDTMSPNAVSVWLQIPAYLLIAASEIFASIASLEYSYTHAPKSLKCMVSALSLLPNAAAALIGMGLGPFAVDPYMHYMYLAVGVTSIVTAALFWMGFRHFDEEDELEARAANSRASESQGHLLEEESIAEDLAASRLSDHLRAEVEF